MDPERERERLEIALRSFICKIGGASIFTVANTIDLQSARERVLHLMSDGDWHTGDELKHTCGNDALRRLRELREQFFVETRPVSFQRRSREYRLRPRAASGTLFKMRGDAAPCEDPPSWR